MSNLSKFILAQLLSLFFILFCYRWGNLFKSCFSACFIIFFLAPSNYPPMKNFLWSHITECSTFKFSNRRVVTKFQMSFHLIFFIRTPALANSSALQFALPAWIEIRLQLLEQALIKLVAFYDLAPKDYWRIFLRLESYLKACNSLFIVRLRVVMT